MNCLFNPLCSLGAPRNEIATEAARKEAAYVQAKQQIEEHEAIVQV